MRLPRQRAGDVDNGGAPVVTCRAFESLLVAKADPRNLENRIAAMIRSGPSRYVGDLLLRPAIDLDADAWWRLLLAYAPDLHVVDAIIEEMQLAGDVGGVWPSASSGGVAEGGHSGE
jgi:hypothetical protein